MDYRDLKLGAPLEAGKLYFRRSNVDTNLFYGPYEDDDTCVEAMRAVDRHRGEMDAFPYDVVLGSSSPGTRLWDLTGVSDRRLFEMELKRARSRVEWLLARVLHLQRLEDEAQEAERTEPENRWNFQT